MKSTDVICELCGKKIDSKQPIFYFPKLHPEHNLVDLKGIMHVACLVSQDAPRKIGFQLAGMTEDLARRSVEASFLRRNGNIVSRYREHEENIEILDFENFCEITIPRKSLKDIIHAKRGNSFSLRFDILKVERNGDIFLENKNSGSSNFLRTLNLKRLHELLP
ncbi:hypothetical protein [Achromobacter xylosoxidans]|uniref:hypothetical protein n=1 Tax=Alcaligenes xylosoxydans xylosoxydans TaxID=85698 RepID=UPI00117741A7|nr:hypothetical protein [Achromobacter xylosoxidans]